MLRYTQENLKCTFEGNKYKYAIIAIYLLILFGFIALNILVYNNLVSRARDRFSEWTKIENKKNTALMTAITAKLAKERKPGDDVTPDVTP